MQDADYWIRTLKLQPHAEGGWYRETWRSDLVFSQDVLPAGYAGERSVCSLIYFLLRENEVSVWHRVRSAELWLWHAGDVLELSLGGGGDAPRLDSTLALGPGGGVGFQGIVPAGVWQSAKLREGGAPGAFALVSCAVSPGFHWTDFSLAP